LQFKFWNAQAKAHAKRLQAPPPPAPVLLLLDPPPEPPDEQVPLKQLCPVGQSASAQHWNEHTHVVPLFI